MRKCTLDGHVPPEFGLPAPPAAPMSFVEGTENPVAQAAINATFIGEEDAAFAGGSYVIVQKYLPDLGKWNAIPVE